MTVRQLRSGQLVMDEDTPPDRWYGIVLSVNFYEYYPCLVQWYTDDARAPQPSREPRKVLIPIIMTFAGPRPI